MNKLTSFIRLDFFTVKPYFTAKNLLIYTAVVLFLTIMSADFSAGLSIGMMLATMHTGYPFVVGEKSNMDALYVTLSLERKTVVLGRYIFTLLFNICFVLAVSAVSLVGMLASSIFRSGFHGAASGGVLLLMPALFMAMQAIQLPMYFKLGYAKAKFMSLVPFFALMVGYMALAGFLGGIAGLSDAFGKIFSGGFAYLAVGAAFLVIVFISYVLSLAFYRKREF
jgi:hypothetical protein